MFENIKNFNDSLKTVKDLKKLLDNPDMVTPEKLMEHLGIDIDDLDEQFNSMMSRPSSSVNLEYVYKSLNQEPSYAYPTDSGFDLRANENVQFEPFERKLVSTGLFLNIPEGFEVQVRPKSGLALNKGLSVLNTPGTVDQGYTGEIKVIVINMGNVSQTIEMGDKIAQAVLCPVVQGKNITLTRVLNLTDKDRNENGFGSTGK
jgi:dUTP pyrophosphatase